MKRTRLVVWAALSSLAAGLVLVMPQGSLQLAPMAAAQNIGQRTVTGLVVSGDSQTVSGATVFLKNQKSKAIRSYTTTKDGKFHFAQVNMAEDYDIWAEKDGDKTATKTVSSWDARKNFEITLKMK
ncbi:MAG: carboxypeptidase regulatory-like domain-containing protein [Acidobacteriota bacterium]|nr:carboxypeptidase regulatory-like domain-containing protein [Acidobacteriota bacterium]